LVSTNVVFSGRRLRVEVRRYEHDGESFVREIVRFGQAVAALPILGNKVLLIKQFRPAVGGWILEIPAGKVEEGEDIYEATRRELVEEIGYEPAKLEHVVSIYPTPGYSDEVIHILFAEDLRYVGPRRERGELIEVFEVDANDLPKIVEQKLVDGKTLIAILLYLAKRVWRTL